MDFSEESLNKKAEKLAKVYNSKGGVLLRRGAAVVTPPLTIFSFATGNWIGGGAGLWATGLAIKNLPKQDQEKLIKAIENFSNKVGEIKSRLQGNPRNNNDDHSPQLD